MEMEDLKQINSWSDIQYFIKGRINAYDMYKNYPSLFTNIKANEVEEETLKKFLELKEKVLEHTEHLFKTIEKEVREQLLTEENEEKQQKRKKR